MIPRPSSTDVVDTSVNPNYAATPGCCSRFIRQLQDKIVGGMENFFYCYGRTVAQYPFLFIVLCFLITGLSTLGLLQIRMENNGLKLWIPHDSSQRVNSDWLWENYPPELRFASMIFIHEKNVLDPEVIRAMYRIHRDVESIVTPSSGKQWSDMCMKAPIVKPPPMSSLLGKRRKRQVEDQDFDDFDNFMDEDFFEEMEDEEGFLQSSDPLEDAGEYFNTALYPEPYCGMIQSMEEACLEMSILELWANEGKFDETSEQEIASLTLDQVLDKINEESSTSGVFLIPKNFTKLLAGVKRDADGRIISAQATVIKWLGQMNATEARLNPVKGRGEPIAQDTLDFEGQMIKVMLNQSDFPPGLVAYPNVQRSFGDIAGSTILGDVGVMAIGYMIVFIYVQIMLGRMNCLEQRSFLALTGFMGVIMGIVVSYGLCSAFHLFFGPMHSVLPFLLLGIGIDDMFVIIQSWDVAEEKRKKSSPKDCPPLPERIGQAISQAGVAITITSITDIIAFGVGGSTILPALSSFCIYASVGIVATYFFQCTFFVAWMKLDIQRVEAKRNACCPCYTHGTEYQVNSCSRSNFIQRGFEQYGRMLALKPVKVLVLLLTSILLAFGITGLVFLRQEFDPTWFLPSDTYLARWFRANKLYFPFGGDRVTVWIASSDTDQNIYSDFPALNQMAEDLSAQGDIVNSVDSWTIDFNRYTQQHFGIKAWDMSPDVFEEKLTQYLYSPKGGRYRRQFRFEREPECGTPAPKLLLSQITFVHKIFSGPEEHVPAMQRVKAIVAKANVTQRVFPLSIGYASWETDEVIAEELYRNIALATLCVFATTLVLLANFNASILVLLCVLLSLTNVGGFMHFWNLTIDTVSCNNLIIAIGLCVDYSAHVAHFFLIAPGSTRNGRMIRTMKNIGPAVLNGGVTTTLAFILLAGSQSHVFSSFFKIFFLVVCFGLFHGLATLPVLLSIWGPPSHVLETSSSVASENDLENNACQDQKYSPDDKEENDQL